MRRRSVETRAGDGAPCWPAGEAPGERPISLLEVRKLCDPSEFLTMLQQHGERMRS